MNPLADDIRFAMIMAMQQVWRAGMLPGEVPDQFRVPAPEGLAFAEGHARGACWAYQTIGDSMREQAQVLLRSGVAGAPMKKWLSAIEKVPTVRPPPANAPPDDSP